MSDKINYSKLDIINTSSGCVMHALNSKEKDYKGFGEIYFSVINSGEVRAWKKHREMHSNLVVPYGKIKFVIYNRGIFEEYTLSKEKYFRLSIPPNITYGFKNVSDDQSILTNIANIPHNINEVENISLNDIKYKW